MPTVIDSLIVELGLDPSKFTKGQQKVLADFKKSQEEAKREARNMEAIGRQTLDFLSTLQTKVIGTLSLFVGGRGIKEFATWATQTAAETGRMSRVLDTNTEKLSAWRGVATVTGGTAEGMTQSISGLVQQFQMFSLTGESSVIPYFRALGVQISDTAGRMRPFEDIMLDLAERFHKMDPAKARAFGTQLGFDDGTINLLIKGRTAVSNLLDEQKKLGVVTKQDADAAEAATKAWREMEQASTSLGRTLVTTLGPSLTFAIRELTEFLSLGGKAGQELDRMDKRRASRGVKTYEQLNPGSPVNKGWLDTIFGLFGSTPADPNAPLSVGQKRLNKPGAAAYGEAQSDIDKLVALGLSRNAATGLVAGFHAESGGRTDAVGDGGKAYGLGQWHPDRQANFEKFAGKDIRQSTRDEQLAFVAHELATTERRAGAALRQARDAGEAARVASSLYERPADAVGEANKRAAIALALQKAPPSTAQIATAAQQGSTIAGATNNNSTSTATTDVRVGTVNIQTQASDVQGIARDMGSAIMNDAFTAQANSGQT